MVMISAALSMAVVLLLLLVSENLWQHHQLKGERGRKFIHIIVGSFVAFWPFFMSWGTIQLLVLLLLLGIVVSRTFNIFRAIHNVRRKTMGEIFFPLGIGAASVLASSASVFAVAVLMMSVADGIAAIIGTRYGKGNEYKIFKQRKSLAGSAAFFISSLCLVTIATFINPDAFPVSMAVFGLIPLGATLLENLGVYGLDNLLVPLYVISVLGFL
jgi:phytol kinase